MSEDVLNRELPEAIEKRFETRRTARYVQLGTWGPDTAEIWLVVHGYGQLARYFIRHFRRLNDGTRLIVAPEGLSRFYLGENQWERVGASWMTREDREVEIADQQVFLDGLLQHVAPDAGRARLVVLGFSQGVATAWRWLENSRLSLQVQHLVLWAGRPPDVFAGFGQHPPLHLHFALGHQDPYASWANTSEVEQRLETLGIPLHRLAFEGGHSLPPDALDRLVSHMAALNQEALTM